MASAAYERQRRLSGVVQVGAAVVHAVLAGMRGFLLRPVNAFDKRRIVCDVDSTVSPATRPAPIGTLRCTSGTSAACRTLEAVARWTPEAAVRRRVGRQLVGASYEC